MSKVLSFILKFFFVIVFAGTITASLFMVGVFYYFSKDLPQIMRVEDYHPAVVSQVFANGDGEPELVAEFYSKFRYLAKYDQIPKHVINAFLAAEDDKFFEHQGVNFSSMIRAFIVNIKAGHHVQGGSTITQQITKSMLLTSEKSYDRKIKEIILSHRLEQNLTKEQILYLYLNEIYLGHGAYGVLGAAKVYYGKDLSKVTIAEAALLAGLPQAPSKYSPNLNPKRAKERQLYVLRRMFENRFITQSEMADAAAEKIAVYPDKPISRKVAHYYIEEVRKNLVEKYGEKTVNEGGLKVMIPLSPKLSNVAEEKLILGIREIDKRGGYRGPQKRLKSDSEIEAFLKQERENLISEKLGYEMFLPDGRIDQNEAYTQAGFKTDADLLNTTNLVSAVVSQLDEKKKNIRILVAGMNGLIDFEGHKWVRGGAGAMPLLHRGDVVRVRYRGKVVQDELFSLEQDPGLQGALLSMDVQTGKVITMVGGTDFQQSQFNRATQAQRQPGSAFKPFIFAAAVEKGFTPTTIISDSPIVFENSGDVAKWKPSNYDEKFTGDTTFRQALIKSRNIPTIKILQEVRVSNLIDFANRLGLTGKFEPDLTIALGSSLLSLMDIVRTYAVFPRYGRKIQPVSLLKVEDHQGQVLEETKVESNSVKWDLISAATQALLAEQGGSSAGGVNANGQVAAENNGLASPNPQAAKDSSALQTINSEIVLREPKVPLLKTPLQGDANQVLDPRTAFTMIQLMKEVVNFGTGYQAKVLNRPLAGKTGTTSDNIDAWFVGFSPDIVTGVWIGNDNLKQIGVGETGTKAALPIWIDYMKEALGRFQVRDFDVPPGITFATIEPKSGKLSRPGMTGIREIFIEGTEPTEYASTENESGSSGDLLKDDFE